MRGCPPWRAPPPAHGSRCSPHVRRCRTSAVVVVLPLVPVMPTRVSAGSPLARRARASAARRPSVTTAGAAAVASGRWSDTAAPRSSAPGMNRWPSALRPAHHHDWPGWTERLWSPPAPGRFRRAAPPPAGPRGGAQRAGRRRWRSRFGSPGVDGDGRTRPRPVRAGCGARRFLHRHVESLCRVCTASRRPSPGSAHLTRLRCASARPAASSAGPRCVRSRRAGSSPQRPPCPARREPSSATRRDEGASPAP